MSKPLTAAVTQKVATVFYAIAVFNQDDQILLTREDPVGCWHAPEQEYTKEVGVKSVLKSIANQQLNAELADQPPPMYLFETEPYQLSKDDTGGNLGEESLGQTIWYMVKLSNQPKFVDGQEFEWFDVKKQKYGQAKVCRRTQQLLFEVKSLDVI